MRSSSLAQRGAAMTVVVLAEKRSVADDIAKVLKVTTAEEHAWISDDIVVTWAVGHLVGLKYPEDYDPEYTKLAQNHRQIAHCARRVRIQGTWRSNAKAVDSDHQVDERKTVTEVVNACDAAREGELIFRSIVEHAGISTPTTRMWLQSMTTKPSKRHGSNAAHPPNTTL